MSDGAGRGALAARSGRLLVLVAFTVASCGGTDDDTETAAPTTTEDATTVTTHDDTGDEPSTSTGAEAEEPITTAGAEGAGDDGADGNPADPDSDTTAGAGEPGPGTTAAADGASAGDAPITGDGPIDPGLQPFIDKAVAQLVDEHGYTPGEITVESARLVQWRSSAAGCPEPRMQYAQVVTDGSAIELVAGGDTYWFHSGGRDGLVLCTSPLREPVPEPDS